MKVTIHTDGGSRGNPGPAGAGVVMRDETGRPLLEAGYFLGRTTNNVAEYTAFIRGVEAALDVGASHLSAFSDSELLVKQVNGQYRVKNPTLKRLHSTGMARLSQLERWDVRHIPREMNERADELANTAMNAGADVVDLGPSEANGKRPRESAESFDVLVPNSRTVIARCTQEANATTCRMQCPQETTFVFENAVPAGICMGVAAEMIQAVNEVRSNNGCVEVTCPRTGCGARFVVRAS